MYKILIVEDDETIAGLLAENVKKWGFEPFIADDFNRIKDIFETVLPHLVIMDISLPFYNGYYWCSEIRKKYTTPILFLSSHTENMDIVMAINMGGDDYVTKPFSMEVLIAKINALLRRSYSYTDDRHTIEVSGAVLDLGAGTVSFASKKEELTKNELKILHALFENKNNIVSREYLMQALWDSDCFIDGNTLTVNINRLRKKLDDIGLADFITTKKGLGYMVHD